MKTTNNPITRDAPASAHILLSLSILALFLSVATAQRPGTPLFVLSGTADDHQLGSAVASIEDISGDGIRDLVIGAQTGGTWPDHPGYVRVVSGANGSPIFTLVGNHANDYFGAAVDGAGDVNADGFEDIVVGARFDDTVATSAGRAMVFSGYDGSLLHDLLGTGANEWFGFGVAGVGDVNGDGHADVAIGGWGHLNYTGWVKSFSGLDGSLLWTATGAGPSGSPTGFGLAVAAAGDVNGDGTPDVLTGASGLESTNGGPVEGGAVVLSGLDGGTLLILEGGVPQGEFGSTVAGIGDANGDGAPELLVGSFVANQARVYSGVDGALLMILKGGGSGYGRSVAGPGDVDGDGHADLAIAAIFGGLTGNGHVFVISGATGSPLFHLDPGGADQRFGSGLAGAGDLDGDLIPDLVVGAMRADPGGLIDAGTATAISLDPLVPPSPAAIDLLATGEATSKGSLVESYVATHTSDGIVEELHEEQSGGKPSKRRSLLDHTWTFELPGAELQSLLVQAWHTPNTEGDDFLIEWSMDAVNWAQLVVITKTMDDGLEQAATLPAWISGALYIRATDTDRTQGNTGLDVLFVDRLRVFAAEGAAPTAPPLPAASAAATAAGDTINLSWVHVSTDEDGFRIERNDGGSSWQTRAILVGSGFTAFSDTDVETGTSYDYRVQAFNGAGSAEWSNVASATAGSGGSRITANGEVNISGVVSSGSYLDTHAVDGVVEEIRETSTSGPPSSRVSYLEHIWTFDVPAGAGAPTLVINAWHSANDEGDDILLSWSDDGENFTSLLVVTKTSNDGLPQSSSLPAVNGTFFVKIEDLDRTPGQRRIDKAHIDFIALDLP